MLVTIKLSRLLTNGITACSPSLIGRFSKKLGTLSWGLSSGMMSIGVLFSGGVCGGVGCGDNSVSVWVRLSLSVSLSVCVCVCVCVFHP